ncbi:MAG: leucine-rich repeat protein [Clostridia bacterium]|nr:leucine-rich repeat protein [Clostridia bacterium]
MKKFLSVLLALLMAALPVFAFGVSADVEYEGRRLMGDINGDHKIDAVDYLMLKRIVLRSYAANRDEDIACDVSGDGEVTAVDYLMVKRAVLGSYEITRLVPNDDLDISVPEGGDHAAVTGPGECEDGEIIIPGYVGGVPVTVIAENAFAGCTGVTGFVLPEGIERIEDGAFSGCTALTSVTIPKSVVWIGANAFAGCSSLQRVYFEEIWGWYTAPSQEELEANVNVFYNFPVEDAGDMAYYLTYEKVSNVWAREDYSDYVPSKGLKIEKYGGVAYYVTGIGTCTDEEIYIPREYNGKRVIYVAAGAFENVSGVKGIYVPSGINKIGRSAFENSSVEWVFIGRDVSEIEDHAFSGCNDIREYRSDPKNKIYMGNGGCLVDKSRHSVVAGSNWPDFPDAEIANGIAHYAFENMTKMESVYIPDGYEAIGTMAFYGCMMIKNVRLPQSMKILGDWCFNYCDIKEIHIPPLVESIGANPFAYNKDLAAVTVAPANWRFSEGDNCVISNLYHQVVIACKNATVPTSEDVTCIDTYAFAGAIGLTEIDIPVFITCIGEYAFDGCVDLAVANFADPYNWYTEKEYVPRTAIELLDVNLDAEYLRETYSDYTWLKIEPAE